MTFGLSYRVVQTIEGSRKWDSSVVIGQGKQR